MLKALNLSNSYFAIANPFRFLERWTRRYSHQTRVRLNDRELLIEWTEPAQKALTGRSQPLNIEMQLYFSCVVKKRVLFHEHLAFESVAANDRINICFRSVQSAVCSPEDFARDYPEARELHAVSDKMSPSRLSFDFRARDWVGEFGYD
jgi:hypothetical protein